ncbi:beta-ketoacyl synthase N-terminal-like domain-containing protein [Phycisphaerales bacterium AB-hyl4]|uniref:Beta-ketoacyl synthase N-terminal-like domain-containing protein n=1 Tax=Natronomicrosphaera hydrolytica TaxID=3242702 RepID=A0ABV4U562_9BACT
MPANTNAPSRGDGRPRNAPRPAARIVIAGLGLVTPLGHAAWETFAALLAGRTLAERAERPDHIPADVAGVDLVRALGAVRVAQHGSSDPSIDLAERAGREAMFQAGRQPRDVPMVLGTSKGAVKAMTDAREALLQALARGQMDDPPTRLTHQAEAVVHGPQGHLTRQLHHRLGTPPHRHVVAACASSLTALHYARDLLLAAANSKSEIRNPKSPPTAPDHVLVLTADAALLPAFIHSYRRLGVLAPLTTTDYRQRPLDRRRQGFMLSEAGAAVLLKRLPPGVEPGIGEIELLDTAVAAETHDIIRPAPTMPALRHVARRLLAERAIDMLHPHATGTPEHDPLELSIYADVLDEVAPSSHRRPTLYANKGALGHSLGAAGLTAFVLACMTLRTGQRPPMPWLAEPMAEARGFTLTADAGPCSRTGTHAIFAAGFAGHVAGAVVQRH